MISNELQCRFGYNTPITSEEIVSIFGKYTRAYVFRMIKRALDSGELMLFSRGVYYIPRNTVFGQTKITTEQVAEKKYIKENGEFFGVYAGLKNLNQFGVTEQIPNTIEIVTNKEATRKRKITINGKEFILRKSRCIITSDNYHEYNLLQLFSDMDEKDKIDDFVREKINKYINNNRVDKEKLLCMAVYFPKKCLNNLIRSGVLNESL